VCVLDGAYLVMDMLRSEKEHTYDWWFHGVPDHSNGLAGIQADFKPRPEPLGKEDGYQMVQNLSYARVSGDLASDWTIPKAGSRDELTFSLRAMNDAPMEAIHGFEWSFQYTKPEKKFLVLRREKTKNADFIVLLQPHGGSEAAASPQRFAVTDTQGRTLENAAGVRVTLGGKQYEIIVNPGGAEVKTAKGSTRKYVSVEIKE
jgi:hypothetical protein